MTTEEIVSNIADAEARLATATKDRLAASNEKDYVEALDRSIAAAGDLEVLQTLLELFEVIKRNERG